MIVLFLLPGILTASLCFVVDNPVPLTATSLLFFAIGCGFYIEQIQLLMM
ncbi:putative membrane protein [Wolbachia endosymbiont of Trichogramma pretiosum]|nr:putative membrane protein [Wolbachia endosymbiont of Trichogramma pretiosum]